MFNPFKIIRASLTGKLISVTVILIIVAVGISWYLLINTLKKRGINDAIKYTMSYTDLVARSTRYNMLMRQRDAIQKTLEDISREKDIEGVRIFDSKGRIHYSSRPEEIGQFVDRDSFACKGCHTTDERPAESISRGKRWVIYTGEDGERILTSVMPIFNEFSCYTGDCHVHPEGQRVLGILQTDYSLSSVDREINMLILKTAIYAIVLIMIGSFILYLVLRRFVLRPVSVLSKAMKRVKSGDLNQMVEITSEDEMGVLGNTFNLMTEELREAREKAEDWASKLEEEVKKKTEELKRSQYKLMEAEKLASLGRLTSDIAHEIRNPLTAIGGFARRLYRIVNGPKEKEYAEIMIEEVSRLEKILKDVLTFSRSAGYNLERQNIKEVIKETVRVYEHLCVEHNIDIEVMIKEDLPPVLIDRDQLRQAISNLITNAIDAMPHGGALTVTADTESLHGVTYVVIRITDTGEGIPEDKLSVIFEPFYSTKEPGVGTGLGLPITRKIMQEHGGFIDVKSAVGKGTTMSLYFPYQSVEESLKMKCWEYMKCGRDGSSGMRCPAYPDFGRICWVVAGTFCDGKAQGTFAQKYEDCRKCEFYQKVREKEI
jgi:two-component system NtrC family sensor kinase